MGGDKMSHSPYLDSFCLSALSDTLSATLNFTIPWHMLCYDGN